MEQTEERTARDRRADCASRQEHEERGAQRADVGPGAEADACDLLGRREHRCSPQERVVTDVAHPLRDTEVRKNHPTLPREEGVLGLHVEVEHARRVDGREDGGEVEADALHVAHGEPPAETVRSGVERLASGSYDNTLGVWDVATGARRRTLRGHSNSVQSVAFSPDGTTLASGSNDNTLRLWDIATGDCLAVLVSAPHGWVAFTPGGRYKLSGDVGGAFWVVANLCRFKPGELDPYVLGLQRLSDEEPLLPGRFASRRNS